MDVLFSPSGVESMPKPAVAEIEKRTEELLKSSSFQRMLELEKKYKTERMKGAQPLLPSSQSPAALQEASPPRPDRPDSQTQQEDGLMLKATRRTAIRPSLSISIPQPAFEEQRDPSNQGYAGKDGENHAVVGTPMNNEHFHKQVKFLAPEDEQVDDEDGMSEQSSICQSPSWEGYGQRKKEKKLEAERRRREKEQAEKEAKSAKRRSTARLSKPPPPAARYSRPAGLTSAERSMSEPSLTSQGLLLSPQQEETGRAASTDDLQQNQPPHPGVTALISNSGSVAVRLAGDSRLNCENESAMETSAQYLDSPTIPHHLMYHDNFPPPKELRRSISEGPASANELLSPAIISKSTGRPSRDACPPSASRTPMLRHMPPSGRNRSNGLLQRPARSVTMLDEKSHGGGKSTANLNCSEESVPVTASVGEGLRDSYVRYHRTQSAERAMAGLADEQLVEIIGPSYAAAKSGSPQTRHTRRPSLTREAKAAAMRLVGMKADQPKMDGGARSDRPSNQSDTIAFKAFPYSASDLDASTSAGNIPKYPNSDGAGSTHVGKRLPLLEASGLRVTRGQEASSNVLERPPTSQSSVSSAGPSTSGSSNSKKGRSLKDAAKAALNIAKGSQQCTDGSKSSVPLAPYFALRVRRHSQAAGAAGSDSSRLPTEAPPVTASSPAMTPSVSNPNKKTQVGASGGCRASEGSSSSSAYDDGSPLPSPTTTPDTSRPQSAKDIPVTTSEMTKGTADPSALQDDERTLRQSFDSNKSSTPRIGDSEVYENAEDRDDDRWTRTALPIDMDCDAQSFFTSVSNQDHTDGADQVVSDSSSAPHATTERLHTATLGSVCAEAREPRLPEPLSNSGKLRCEDTEPVILIPPRSKKRDQIVSARSTRGHVASSPSTERREEDAGRSREGVPGSRENERLTVSLAGSAGEEDDSQIGSESPSSRSFSYSAKYSEQVEKRTAKVENHVEQHQRQTRPQELNERLEPKQAEEEEEVQQATLDPDAVARIGPGSLRRRWASRSISSSSSTVPSAGSLSPIGSPALLSDFQIPSNPYFAEFPEPEKDDEVPVELPRAAATPSPMSLPSPLHQVSPRPPAQPQMHSAPTASSGSTTVSRASTPAGRASGITPVSILKQPKNLTSEPPQGAPSPSSPRHVLSAIPRHMQLQAGISARPPAAAVETRKAPIAKMLVECCSCKFYHDMPSKIYECMAKPDAVVEDKVLGISGEITTMVKCPWCQHNMSRNCCAGYAAVVYLKEKLH
ncbi:hypothetical protein VTK56DRAFT_8028 [Thermocarpiscus australiensis]